MRRAFADMEFHEPEKFKKVDTHVFTGNELDRVNSKKDKEQGNNKGDKNDLHEEKPERDMLETFGYDTRTTQIKGKRLVNPDDIRLLAGREKKDKYLYPPEVAIVRNVRIKMRDLVQDDEEHLKRMSSIQFTEAEVA